MTVWKRCVVNLIMILQMNNVYLGKLIIIMQFYPLILLKKSRENLTEKRDVRFFYDWIVNTV